MYFSQQRLDWPGVCCLRDAIYKRGLTICPERHPNVVGKKLLDAPTTLAIINLFDDEGEANEVIGYIKELDQGDQAKRLTRIVALASYLRPCLGSWIREDTEFKKAREGIIRECIVIALAYWCGLDMSLFSRDLLYQHRSEAYALLDQACEQGLKLDSMEKAVRLVTNAKCGSDLTAEGWCHRRDAYSRGYIKVADSNEVRELHMRGQMLGMLSSYDHYSGSTWYFLKHHYKFDPLDEALSILGHYDGTISINGRPIGPRLDYAEHDASMLISRYITPI